MRVGVLTHTLNSIDGGFHYEVVFLNALSELATRFPEELVYLTSPQHNLAALASTGRLAYCGLPIRVLQQAPAQLQPPEVYLQTKPVQQPKGHLDPFHCAPKAAMPLRNAAAHLLLLLRPPG